MIGSSFSQSGLTRAGRYGSGPGSNELAEVIGPRGHVLLLDHMRSTSTLLGGMMEVAIPIIVRATGLNMNRRTLEGVRRSRLKLDKEENFMPSSINKLIIARSRDDPSDVSSQ